MILVSQKGSFLYSLLSGVQMSTLLYLSLAFLTSANVVPRWVQLQPYPYQILPIISLIVGVLISNGPICSSYLWFAVASLGGFFLCNLDGIPGLLGGCAVIMYTASSFHQAVHNLSLSFAFSSTLAFGLFMGHVVALIWTVAYNFVPLGWILRERIGLLLAIWLSGLACGNLFGPFGRQLMSPRKRATFRVVCVYLGLILVLVGAPVVVHRYLLHNLPPVPSTIQSTNSFDFSSMIWTVHFGYDNNGESNFYGAADLVRSAGICFFFPIRFTPTYIFF
jgi:hypothetical protein